MAIHCLGLNLEEQVLKNKCDIKELQEGGIDSPVKSVNGKTGDVVLNGTDIKLTTNQQTVQANFIRIDEEIGALQDIVDTLTDDVANMLPPYSALTAGKILAVDNNGHLYWAEPGTPPEPPTGYTVTISASPAHLSADLNKIYFLDENQEQIRGFDLEPIYNPVTEEYEDPDIPLTVINNVSYVYLYAHNDTEEVIVTLTTTGGNLTYTLPSNNQETDGTFSINNDLTITGVSFNT